MTGAIQVRQSGNAPKDKWSRQGWGRKADGGDVRARGVQTRVWTIRDGEEELVKAHADPSNRKGTGTDLQGSSAGGGGVEVDMLHCRV